MKRPYSNSPVQINESNLLQMGSGILPMPTRLDINTSSGSSLVEKRINSNNDAKVAISTLNFFDVAPMTQFDDIGAKVPTSQIDDIKPSLSLNNVSFPSVIGDFEPQSNVDFKTNANQSTTIVKSEWEKMKQDEYNDYPDDFEYNVDFSLFVSDSGYSNFDSVGNKSNCSLSNFPWYVASEQALMKEGALSTKEFNRCDFATSNGSHFLSPTSRLLSLASCSGTN